MLSKLIETPYIFLYKMTLAHYVLSSLLLLCQLSLHPAQESKENLEYSASFNCGNFSKIRFPFSNTENPKCGLFVMNCSGSKPTIQFHESGKWYQVDYMNELDRTIVISDQAVQHHLESNHCDLLGNFTEEDTRFLSINVTRIHPFFKCKMHTNLTHQDKFFKAFINYTSCLDYVLYFYKDGRRSLPHLWETLSSLCSVIQYSNISIYWFHPAYKERRNTHISDFITQSLVLPDCGKCQHDGGECQSNPKQALESGNLKKDRRVGLKVGIGIGTGVGGILLTCIGFILYQRHKRDFSSSSNLISRRISDGSLKPNFKNGSIYFQTPIFTYKELDEATNHFDSKKELGDGGYGTVYHGKLRDGRVVAVKRLFEHNYKRVEQFMNEIEILSGLRHQNLVSLYGCTSQHSRELLLVYEYVPNGTVADHLHGDRAGSGLLTWPIRMSIAIESADAVAYLHASDIIHRDIKTNNILLDNGFHVKVADFGLSRLFPTDVTHVSTAPQGTPGYVDPEYYQCYQLNDKSDVYSFGVVLIELISSQLAVDIGRHRHEINLANLAVNRIHSQALHELVDPSLGFDSDYDVRIMITLVAELAFRCLQQDRETRPSMVEVVDILKGIESEEYKKKKKNDVPVSPDSVTGIWISTSSTPNTSA